MKKRFRAKIYEAEEKQLRGVDISCNIIDDVKAPKWFTEFVDNQFVPLVEKVTKIETDVAILKTDVADLKVRMTKLETRIDNIVEKNNLVE